MSKVQFSWNNQKGIGVILLFYGWSFIMQIPAIYYNYLVIKVPVTQNDWLAFTSSILFVTVFLGAMTSTIYENLFNPFDRVLVNVHTVVITSFLVFSVFYIFATPTILFVEPFLGLPSKFTISGWSEYIIDLLSGVIGIAIYWYLSELIVKAKSNKTATT